MVAKMKFPVSALPTIKVVSNLILLDNDGFMWWILNGVYPKVAWLQWITISSLLLLVALGVLNSCISVLVREYHILYSL